MSGSTGYSWRSEYSPMYSYLSTDVSPSSWDKFEYYAVVNYRNVSTHALSPLPAFNATYDVTV